MAKANEAKREAQATEPPSLRLSRILHARRETVFKAWSSAEHVKRWFAPETFTVPEARVEMRVGGAFELAMRSAASEVNWVRGRFVEIVPNARLVIDMEVTDAVGAALFRALTEVDFADALGGTRLDVAQSYTVLDPSKAWMVAGAPEGWRSTLDKLEKEVVRMQGGAETVARSVVHASFHLERRYEAPVARVWRALTDETAKAKWFAGTPGKWELLERRMDVRVGGSERLSGRWEDGVVSSFDAVYHDVVPNERLVYSYTMHLDEKKISVSLATLQLAAEGGTTRLKVTEQGAFFDGYDDAGSREHGTGHLLDALGASLAD
ncbi:MAG TPA: SRPBCC family protein [Stellaceae bacterium]|nr:SRPBCC family protein [Stellaceae bacterium]